MKRLNDKYEAKAASTFGDVEQRFVWKPYIPVGDYTVLMADGGTGKTILCCGIAADLSRGIRLPGEIEDREPQTVLIISAEDRGELLKSRLLACGADLDRIYLVDCIQSEGLNFTDHYDDFFCVIAAHAPALVVIDPWHAFLGADVDINRVNAVRPVFQKIANLAKMCNCGMILVSHVNKRAQGENANNAATGSADFVNAARSAIRVIFDDTPGRESYRTLVHTKSNYAAAGRSISYRIAEDGGLLWGGFSDITRQTLEAAARSKRTPYEELLRQGEQASANFALRRALKEYAEKAQPGKAINISYDQVKADYGADIFNGQQAKRVLDTMTRDFALDGITIQTGKTVRENGRTKNGFSLLKQVPQDVFESLPGIDWEKINKTC